MRLRKPRTIRPPSLLAIVLLLPLAALADFQFPLNLQKPVTIVGREIYDLNTVINWICAGIFVVVFIPMFYALWHHRKSLGHQPHHFHENSKLETLWTIVPFLVLIGIAIPTTAVVVDMKDTSKPDMTVKVTGRQWKWEYEYLGQEVKYISTLATSRDQVNNKAPKSEHYLLEVDKPLVVPTGQKVRLVFTSADVIHAWWVPALGVKQDAIPGFLRDAWIKVDEPGTYRGQCAELCGVDHGYMPIVVEAVPPAKFAAWMDQQKTQLAEAKAAASKEYALAELVAMGEKVYKTNCVSCHQANGQGLPPAFPPLDNSKVVTGAIEGHLSTVFHGRPGTAMQAFGPQLSDLDIAAVVTYERNSWHNKTGNAVQPREVAALRK
ncbi:MAG TPA: cytochrome c oxidase subunit II [Rhodocyclaceae bacterium]|nr:cytochrome c oxidase subunit II [Rhodocyclaceae bacterium]